MRVGWAEGRAARDRATLEYVYSSTIKTIHQCRSNARAQKRERDAARMRKKRGDGCFKRLVVCNSIQGVPPEHFF
jgi:hypothetical protein